MRLQRKDEIQVSCWFRPVSRCAETPPESVRGGVVRVRVSRVKYGHRGDHWRHENGSDIQEGPAGCPHQKQRVLKNNPYIGK